jgi:hypothetical protein
MTLFDIESSAFPGLALLPLDGRRVPKMNPDRNYRKAQASEGKAQATTLDSSVPSENLRSQQNFSPYSE